MGNGPGVGRGRVGGGRRRVGQDWEAKCRRPNNGQAASTDLPTPSLVRSVNLFPFCSANIGPSICPVRFTYAMHCPLRVIHTRSVSCPIDIVPVLVPIPKSRAQRSRFRYRPRAPLPLPAGSSNFRERKREREKKRGKVALPGADTWSIFLPLFSLLFFFF